jgi:hypothetical protein
MSASLFASQNANRIRHANRSLVRDLAALALVTICALEVAHAQGKSTSDAGSGYVAMGSSFAAGPGITTREANSPSGCRRSNDNYAHILARQRGLVLTDRSCSGARTNDVLTGGQFSLPAQLEAVKKDTTLVTVTIGGNDVAYIGNLFAWSCANNRTSTPALWQEAGICTPVPTAKVEEAFLGLEKSMSEIATRIRQQAPGARIIYVDYVTILPDTDICAQVPLTDSEMHAARAVAKRLADITKRVAEETGSELVRASALTHGHDACSTEPWVAGYEFSDDPRSFGPLAYHPKLEAMDAIATALGVLLDTPRKNTPP